MNQSDPHKFSSLDDVRIVELDCHDDSNGKLAVIDNGDRTAIPFAVKRVFYLYDVPADSERGGHSHYRSEELIVAATGAFDVVLDDGKSQRVWHLDRPFRGLYIPRGIWRTINNFTGGAVCMVLTSTVFSESDYVRDYGDFLKKTEGK